MELKSVRSYKSAFNFIRNFILVLIPCVFFTICFLIYLLLTQASRGYESIWVLNPKTGIAVNASQEIGEKPEEREAEYYNLVYQFVNNWYAFDQFTYEKNTTMALNWVGNSGKVLLNAYKAHDVLRRMQEKNMVLTVDVDSIRFNMNTVPVTGEFALKQTITTPAGKLTRLIKGSFFMTDLKERTILNPHKALMDGIETQFLKEDNTTTDGEVK